LDLRQLFVIGKRWLWLLALSLVLAVGAGAAVSSVQPKVFEAKTTLIVGQSQTSGGQDYSQLLASQQLATTYASIATHRPRLDAVIHKLNLHTTPEELSKRVSAVAPTDSTLVILTARASGPDEAAATANALAEALINALPAIQGQDSAFQASIEDDMRATQDQVAVIQGQLDDLYALKELTPEQVAERTELQGELANLRSTYATLLSFLSRSSSSLLTISEPAVPPLDPISPRPLLSVLLAAILGLAVAIGIVTVFEYLRDSMRNPDEVLAATGLTTLGSIAQMKRAPGRSEMYQLAALLFPRSSTAEAYRTLALNIEFSEVDAPLRTLLVTSALPNEGKTITAANIAIVFAQAGRRVLLVDADLRRPGIHSIFGLANTAGLTTVIRRDDPSLYRAVQSTEVTNLEVLGTGPLPPNPQEQLGSHRMREAFERFATEYDLVVVDSPPLQAVADAAILGSFLVTCLVVIDARRSRRRATRSALQSLERAGARVLGAVLNRASLGAEDGYVGYYGDIPETAPAEGYGGSIAPGETARQPRSRKRSA
jgi:capsular exopolysaccharide synthesis family protein